MRWWDTSAVVSLVLGEETTEAVKALLATDDRAAVWWGTQVEATSAISRLQRRGSASPTTAERLSTKVEAFLSPASEIPPSEEVRAAACRALRVHDLRAGDALQLAAALVWVEHRSDGVGFVCLDRRLREAAMLEGFTVLPEGE